MSERGFCADSQKCQLLCVHVPAGHDQFYRDYTSQEELYTTTLFPGTLLSTSMLCVPLSPSSPRRCAGAWRAILYLILYSTAAADTYCYVNFGSTLNPSMLMLVGETNSSEASSFLSALISAEVLFSSVGWILLLALIQILIVIFRQATHQAIRFLVTVLELASVKKRLMAIPRMTAAMPASFGILCLIILITSMLHLLAQQGGLP